VTGRTAGTDVLRGIAVTLVITYEAGGPDVDALTAVLLPSRRACHRWVERPLLVRAPVTA
jgi:hypothetical protein